jgi:hypothetical protein
MFIVHNERANCQLSSPFTYFRRVVESNGSSEMMSVSSTWVRLGASESEKPLELPIERFFASIRFEHREKLAELPQNWSNY